MIKLFMDKFYVVFFSGFFSGLIFSILISLFFIFHIRRVSPQPRSVAKVVVIFIIFSFSSLILGPLFSSIYSFLFLPFLGEKAFFIYFLVVFLGISILSNLIVILKKLRDLKIIIILNLLSGVIFSLLPPIFYKFLK